MLRGSIKCLGRFLIKRDKHILVKQNRKKKVSQIFGRIKVIALVATMAIGLSGLYAGVRHLIDAPYFKVREIRWFGLKHLEQEALNQQVRWAVGGSLFRVDLSRIHGAMLSNAWVKEATVRRDFPDRLTVMLIERAAAVVLVHAPDKMVLLDSEGTVLEEKKAYPPGLPRVIRFDPQSYVRGLPLMVLAASESSYLVDLSNSRDLLVRLPEGALHFGDRDFIKRWNRFKKVESDLKQRELYRWEMDLRFSDKVVVRPGVGRLKTSETLRHF